MNASMSRRFKRNSSVGDGDSSGHADSHEKPENSPLASVCLLVVATLLTLSCLLGSSVLHKNYLKKAKPVQRLPRVSVALLNRTQLGSTLQDVATTSGDSYDDALPREMGIRDALPILQDVYGKYMHRVLHVGPGTCDIVAHLLQEEGMEVWGIEPSDIENPSLLCKNLIKKGLVRIGEVYRSLPYRSRSFSFVYATHTLEHLSSRQLNRTLPELSRLAEHALVVFISSQPSAESFAVTQMQAASKPVKHHNRTWWSRRFEMAGLEENEQLAKQFESLQADRAFKTSDYIFHFQLRNVD